MDLAGQANSTRDGERGYAMAALLVAMSIMAIMFTVVMPVWKQTTQREKEEELVFRGKQYIHAISLFQRKFANAFPPNVDLLVEQRFLRRKFKDPITNDDFVPIPAGQVLPGGPQPAVGQRAGAGTTPGVTGGVGQQQAASSTQPGTARPGGPPVSTGTPGQAAGGIQGVTSKSKAPSIRLYNGRGHYNEWAIVSSQQQQAAGAGGAPGSTTPGGTGQPGQPQGPVGLPGQRGRGTFGPNGPGSPGSPGGPNGPGARGGSGGTSPFGGGRVAPIQPPSTPRGRF